MLTLKSISTSYGSIKVLKNVDLHVHKGSITSLIGANAAGKSTTLMTISGVVKPDSGDILFDNISIVGMPPHEIVRLGISQSPEGRRIFASLSVIENLQMGAYTKDFTKKEFNERLQWIFSLFDVLKERSNYPAGLLSGGQQQMLAIARALMPLPKLLLLDEPSLGLAPIIVNKIFHTIKEISRSGVTILLVEQNAKAALRLSDFAYVIETGQIVLQGGGAELLHDERVKQHYLGG